MSIETTFAVSLDTDDQDMALALFLEKPPGADVQQLFTRSFGAQDIGTMLVVVKQAAEAAAAIAGLVLIIRKFRSKNPNTKTRLRIRFGSRVDITEIRTLREIGCEIEYTQEPNPTFGQKELIDDAQEK